AILIKDALALRFLVAERNDFLRVAPIHFGFVGSQLRRGRSYRLLPAAMQPRKSNGEQDNRCETPFHRPAPWTSAAAPKDDGWAEAVFCGFVSESRVLRDSRNDVCVYGLC